MTTTPAEKIRKLLALARDPAATPGEADTARRKAIELAIRHGLYRPEPPKRPRPEGSLSNFFATMVARELGVIN